jgi:hypothetical protein
MQLGHTSSACSLQRTYKNPTSDTFHKETSLTRTRTVKVSTKTLEDILYDNHLTIQPLMKHDIDVFVKTHFAKRGMVDEYALSEHIGNTPINFVDDGHLKVLGYIVGKYCEVSHPCIKEVLRQVDQIKLRSMGIIPVTKGDVVHFRKMSYVIG